MPTWTQEQADAARESLRSTILSSLVTQVAANTWPAITSVDITRPDAIVANGSVLIGYRIATDAAANTLRVVARSPSAAEDQASSWDTEANLSGAYTHLAQAIIDEIDARVTITNPNAAYPDVVDAIQDLVGTALAAYTLTGVMTPAGRVGVSFVHTANPDDHPTGTLWLETIGATEMLTLEATRLAYPSTDPSPITDIITGASSTVPA